MNIFRSARTGAALALAALGGCAYRASFVNDTHPAWTQVELSRDDYQCMREAAGPESSGTLVANSAGAFGEESSGTGVNRDLLRACLAARGWRETTPGWKKLF
ncbi:MAG TPA: hypothetical protein VN660_01750 [Steroidobacteraceae bacterium]|nr:hypothetical protein [Steroidobacteraceae bacterium]